MNKLWLISFLILLACQEQESISSQNLSQWQMEHNGNSYAVEIPSNNISDLLQHGLIADPFIGTNEDSIQWVTQRNWKYHTRFDVLPSIFKHSKKELIFYGLDTYAEFFLNDSLILNADNMFRKWTVSVEGILKEQDNLLSINFLSNEGVETQKVQRLGYDLPGGNRVHTRKAGFHYGWDWGAKINHIYLNQSFLSDTLAQLEAHIEVDVLKEGIYQIVVNDSLHFFTIPKGKKKLTIPISIQDPKLWWPNGHGNQHLYTFSFFLKREGELLCQENKKFGLRTIELITDPTLEGSDFFFKVNGKAIFMKGANYIPQDHLQNRVQKSDYHQVLNTAVSANMNMLRVWGGGIYEEDIFYDLCDSLGLLVWQDFMFACAMYPSDSLFLQSVKEEAIYNVKRLRNHPSIALSCGNNENAEGWQRWGWQNAYDAAQKEEIERGYDTIFNAILPLIVKQYTDLPYWESSPKLGRGDPQHQFEGDAHYWGVWHDAEPFSVLEHKVPRFMSEFGFQSFPSLSTIAQFADTIDWSLDSEVMQSHQKHPRGNALILEYMAREYNVPKSFEKLVYASQILQAEGMRIGLEAHRRNQPYCMGTLYWQLNDCWPVASWSSIDYYGHWKALHYVAKDVFSAVSLSISKDQKGFIQLSAMSDLNKNLIDTLQISVYDLSGDLISQEEQIITISANTSTTLVSDFANYKANQFIQARLLNAEVMSKTLLTSLPKSTRFIKPVIKHRWDGNTLIIHSDRAAFQVYLQASDGHFSDNFFTLLPQAEKFIQFEGEESNKNKFVIWSLYDLQDNEK